MLALLRLLGLAMLLRRSSTGKAAQAAAYVPLRDEGARARDAVAAVLPPQHFVHISAVFDGVVPL